jgi:ABC transport system ATP-binding/permease protein
MARPGRARGTQDPTADDAFPSPVTVLYDGGRYDLTAEELRIGRGPANGVVIADELVSPEHARIFVSEGALWISDLATHSGTYVNGERIGDEPRPLTNGDKVAIAGRTLHILRGNETSLALRTLPVRETQRIRLTGERLTIGRDPSSDLLLEDPNVSRFHAEVSSDEGRVELVDLGSRNGTRVDGKLVERAVLDGPSEIGIGPFRLLYDGTELVARNEGGALRLDARDVSVEVKGKVILAPTSLAIEPGEFVAFIGESGSGKTTLMRALAGVRRPSGGLVTLNGEPVSAHLTDIGYVPQDEIVHGRLTVVEALRYSARLRLPPDSSTREIDEAVEDVLEELSLTEHAHTRVGALSGGQRKRAGVAAELLRRPSVLFLDEPTTGLDPGLESRLMELLRKLADRSRAVAVVTHATKSLGLCDKLVVMGRGGELSFHGTPAEAAEFFEVETYDDIYTALDRRPAVEWRRQFDETPRTAPDAPQPEDEPERRQRGSRARGRRRRRGPQTRVLAHRYLRLFARDRRNLLILIGQVPVLALAVVGLFHARVFSSEFGHPNQAAQVMFLLVTIAIWIGSIDASREIIKERAVLEREVAVGVRISAYLLSKVVVLFALAALQTLVLVGIVFALRPFHQPADTYLAVVGILVLTSFVAVAVGLVVSALVRSEDQATSFIPLVLIPQLLFSGSLVAVAKMSEPVKSLSSLVFAQWAYAGAGTLADFNDRIAADPAYAKVSGYGRGFFDVPALTTYAILAAFMLAFLVIVEVLLRRQRA